MINLFSYGKINNYVCCFLYFALITPTLSQTAVVNHIALYQTSLDVTVVNGVLEVESLKDFQIWLFGNSLEGETLLSFSENPKGKGESCNDDRSTKPLAINAESSEKATASLNFKVTSGVTYYICVKGKTSNGTTAWIHQGNSNDLKIVVKKKGFALPLWIQVLMIAVLMMLSGLFSGLNLGLMSLDPNELQIVCNSGTAKQRKYSRKIMPVRKHGNFLLCTLLLGNTLVNASFTILLDNLTSGIVAVVGSTLAIVIFGEIVPQSICSRYGLAIGAYTIYLTKFFMVLTFPLSYPVSKLLDCVLGKELGSVYNKQQLLEMLKVQHEYNDLEQDEVGIISGALKYKSKTVAEVMTSIDDCFLLDEEAVLDFQTMSAIIRTGYSRIPIYSTERSNVVALLFVKDLAFVDPDDCIPLLSVIKFYNHPVHKVFDDTTLDKMLEEFKQGTTHLSVVLKVNDGGGEMDPFYECIGIVTLEDIIEEIIQAEIVDETDVYVDNVSGKKVHRKHHNQDFTLFLPAPSDALPKISSQLAFAIYQFLSTAVDVFDNELITRNVLKKIIQHPGIVEERELPLDKSKVVHLYEKGVHADYFMLMIQGRVEVTVGDENIVFEDGPFSVFGMKALTSESGHQFRPDYTVKILTNVQYMKVNRSLYRSAVRASKMESENKTPDNYQEFDEIFWTEFKKKENGSADASLHFSDDVTSIASFESGKNTPSKLEQRRQNSLLRKLAPKYDKRKEASKAEKNDPRNSLECDTGSLRNPLISNEIKLSEDNSPKKNIPLA